MTLVKAIEVLKHGGTQQEQVTATRLGIEALQFINEHRKPHLAVSLPILPGEAEAQFVQHPDKREPIYGGESKADTY